MRQHGINLSGVDAQTDEARISQMVANVAGKVNEILIVLDEVACPHCNGRGQTGLIGDLCSYCGGSCYVSNEEAVGYAPEDLEETNCPHCNGRGTTGLIWDLCGYVEARASSVLKWPKITIWMKWMK